MGLQINTYNYLCWYCMSNVLVNLSSSQGTLHKIKLILGQELHATLNFHCQTVTAWCDDREHLQKFQCSSVSKGLQDVCTNWRAENHSGLTHQIQHGFAACMVIEVFKYFCYTHAICMVGQTDTKLPVLFQPYLLPVSRICNCSRATSLNFFCKVTGFLLTWTLHFTVSNHVHVDSHKKLMSGA